MGMMRDKGNRGHCKESMGRDDSSMKTEKPSAPKSTGPADGGMNVRGAKSGTIKRAGMSDLEG